MKVDTFSVRDLRERIGDLTRDAESGRLSLVTKRGRPLFVAVPFSEELLREGVGFSLALQLYQDEVITAGRAATIAGMGLAEQPRFRIPGGISLPEQPSPVGNLRQQKPCRDAHGPGKMGNGGSDADD